ncbi:MAG: alpha-L-fucosidase [Lentisphaerae bacterium]|nr:alpha-L-fucosidase [Lentisphaerota bacterium]
MNWFENARFGMFIHWGLYAVPGGEWDNMDVPWVSEWVMNKFRIPIKEYEKLAGKFNPADFNADKWVKQIRDAGMKYLVFTAKHHDGFAMFHSTYDSYNVVDATPFGRDVLAELAAACRKYGIKLGCYYSQDQDWHEADASGNNWDFPPRENHDSFARYLNGKVKHQLREILTNYGEIAIIWFDTPNTITESESKELTDFVHSLQPECLVSGRVGNGKGDYDSLGDNAIPRYAFTRPTEGLGTMNESWGYHRKDDHYRKPLTLIRNLARMCSRNANYLLNVGPTELGTFPAPAVTRLKHFGRFLKDNSEALYGAKDCQQLIQPFDFHWGELTAKENAVYLWVTSRTSEIKLFGIRSEINSVSLLANGRKLDYTHEHRNEYDWHKLLITGLKELTPPYVIKAALAEKLDINEKSYFPGNTPTQQKESKL